jgi:hypothetical protein
MRESRLDKKNNPLKGDRSPNRFLPEKKGILGQGRFFPYFFVALLLAATQIELNVVARFPRSPAVMTNPVSFPQIGKAGEPGHYNYDNPIESLLNSFKRRRFY